MPPSCHRCVGRQGAVPDRSRNAEAVLHAFRELGGDGFLLVAKSGGDTARTIRVQSAAQPTAPRTIPIRPLLKPVALEQSNGGAVLVLAGVVFPHDDTAHLASTCRVRIEAVRSFRPGRENLKRTIVVKERRKPVVVSLRL